LTISRGTSHEIVGPTKTGQIRRITLGETAAELWQTSVATWRPRNDGTLGPWLTSPQHDHASRLTTGGLGHWFALATDAGQPDVTLHRLRHSVATALVSRGDLVQAHYRLGHQDPMTTLRTYTSCRSPTLTPPPPWTTCTTDGCAFS
jgi:integrase